jgi:hypothetical protein
MALAPFVNASAADGLTEYRVKSAFLYNFLKFVKWPPGSFKTANDPVIICTVGQDPLKGTLDETIQGKRIDSHPVATKRISSPGEMKGCQVIFVAGEELPHAAAHFANSVPFGVLTVSEVSDPSDRLRHDAAITFIPDGNRIRFTVCPKVAEKSGVEISSKLLAIAVGVE